jgi:hypothetical protein
VKFLLLNKSPWKYIPMIAFQKWRDKWKYQKIYFSGNKRMKEFFFPTIADRVNKGRFYSSTSKLFVFFYIYICHSTFFPRKLVWVNWKITRWDITKNQQKVKDLDYIQDQFISQLPSSCFTSLGSIFPFFVSGDPKSSLFYKFFLWVKLISDSIEKFSKSLIFLIFFNFLISIQDGDDESSKLWHSM